VGASTFTSMANLQIPIVGAGLLAKAVGQSTFLSTDTTPSRASPLPQVFVSELEGIKRGLCRVFMHMPCYVRKATKPCAVAYGYARIRRLVRLGAGLYRLLATAHQWSGLVARVASVVHKYRSVRFRFPALDGGCAQGTLGCAGKASSPVY